MNSGVKQSEVSQPSVTQGFQRVYADASGKVQLVQGQRAQWLEVGKVNAFAEIKGGDW